MRLKCTELVTIAATRKSSHATRSSSIGASSLPLTGSGAFQRRIHDCSAKYGPTNLRIRHIMKSIFGERFALYYGSCLSCLTVTLVYCGQTIGWIKMPLGTEVGLGPDDIVLDGDCSSHMDRGTAVPTFWAMSIVAKRSPISATAELLL